MLNNVFQCQKETDKLATKNNFDLYTSGILVKTNIRLLNKYFSKKYHYLVS